MSLPGWKQETVKALAEFVGPVAQLLIEDALQKCGIAEHEMTAAGYLKFLQALHAELPTEIDRKNTCLVIKRQVLKKYGF